METKFYATQLSDLHKYDKYTLHNGGGRESVILWQDDVELFCVVLFAKGCTKKRAERTILQRFTIVNICALAFAYLKCQSLHFFWFLAMCSCNVYELFSIRSFYIEPESELSQAKDVTSTNYASMNF